MKPLIGLILAWMMVSVGWAYDPMAPPGFDRGSLDGAISENKASKKQPQKPEFILRQIVLSNGHKSAVINGYIVNEGSYLKRARVEKIEAQRVVLNLAGQKKVLHLKPKVAPVRRKH